MRCAWRSTQVVANLVLFLKQFESSIYSRNSKHILMNNVPNDRQSYHVDNFMILTKVHKFWAQSKQNFTNYRTCFQFFNPFQILNTGSHTVKMILKFLIYYYYYNGLILPLYPVLCCFKRDFYSVSSGSRDISVLLSLFQFLFIYFFFYLFIFSFHSLLLFFFFLVV